MLSSHGQIIVVGNEKGGSGKSTTAIHLIVGLLHAGHSVASVDLDGRQGSLTRFFALRQRFADKQGITLIQPKHETVPSGEGSEQSMAGDVLTDIRELGSLLRQLSRRFEAVVVDTAGNDSQRNRLAHTMADILITPLNDSFLDLDILATIDPDTMTVERPSNYAETVWQQRTQRAHLGLAATDWIVMRNRLSSLDAVSKRDMARLLDILALRFGFRLLPGFGERVVFREMFLKGLTIMDIKDDASNGKCPSASHLAARQEVEILVNAIHLKPESGSGEAPRRTPEAEAASVRDETEVRAQP